MNARDADNQKLIANDFLAACGLYAYHVTAVYGSVDEPLISRETHWAQSMSEAQAWAQHVYFGANSLTVEGLH